MKLWNVLIIFLVLALFAGCGNGQKLPAKKNAAGTNAVKISDGAADAPAQASGPSANGIWLEAKQAADGQVVEIKEKMFIAQTNDVYLNPDDYLGKTLKLEGIFKTEDYGNTDKTYCLVLRYGPGCCGNDGNAGFEVAWDGASHEPLPKTDDWVEATGTLKSYEEDGFPYLYISLSSLVVEETRGAEFVAQ